MLGTEREHVITYAFQTKPTIDGKIAGGLPSVISAELHNRTHTPPNNKLIVISDDNAHYDLVDMHAVIESAEEEKEPNFGRFDVWFDEDWTTLHPHGSLRPYQSHEALHAMFKGEYVTPSGSLERTLEHLRLYGPLKTYPDANIKFNERFDKAFQAIKDGSVVNWQDFFFVPSMLKHADSLRERECLQTFHLHTTLPEELDQFSEGIQLLQAMSKMDQVYLHTDEYVRRLEKLLEKNGLPVPLIRRFDLGVDQLALKAGIQKIRKDNYQEQEMYKSLDPERKQLIDEVFNTQGTIPHRFISIDRPDPGKGTALLLDATDEYLSSLGEDPDQLREKYRFFFILPDQDNITDNPYHLKHRYMEYVVDYAQKLALRYPGIVFTSNEVPPGFIPSLLHDAHVMTGGIQDGLNLACQEGLFVNAVTGTDRSAVIGLGTGFAMQTVQNEKTRHLAHFTRAGSVEDITKAIQNLVATRTEQPGRLKANTNELANTVIFQRKDSVVVDL